MVFVIIMLSLELVNMKSCTLTNRDWNEKRGSLTDINA